MTKGVFGSQCGVPYIWNLAVTSVTQMTWLSYVIGVDVDVSVGPKGKRAGSVEELL